MEPAVGYRAWRTTDSRLVSMVTPLVWEPHQVQKARCLSDTIAAPYLQDPWRPLLAQHSAPSSGCSCGFYAAYRLGDVLQSRLGRPRRGRCLGAIAAWGRVVLHPEGFRAESVRLLALWVPQKDAGRPAYASTIRSAASAYGVPVFDNATDLEAYAGEFGVNYAPEPNKPPSPGVGLTRLLRPY